MTHAKQPLGFENLKQQKEPCKNNFDKTGGNWKPEASEAQRASRSQLGYQCRFDFHSNGVEESFTEVECIDSSKIKGDRERSIGPGAVVP
jgi:hypothetical protein